MEFDLVDAIRARTAQPRADVALGIGDDAALLEPPPGMQLVACTDALVAGVHFPVDTAPGDIGWKALAVNLSDLAAMGAQPAWALLALALPEADAGFVEAFADGFAALARAAGVALVGGDTTRGPLNATVTALGWLPRGQALRRDGARVGDAVYVTGQLGDAAGALELLGRGTPNPALQARLSRPQPRLAAGLALRGTATACIDVSDGLVADLGHVCAASGVGAELQRDALPVSATLVEACGRDVAARLALAGGDDYELCFTADASLATEVAAGFADRMGCAVTRIGCIVAGRGIRVHDAGGRDVAIGHPGWEHFAP